MLHCSQQDGRRRLGAREKERKKHCANASAVALDALHAVEEFVLPSSSCQESPDSPTMSDPSIPPA
jgi:hypothetical protein